MEGFAIGKILAGLRNPEVYLRKIKQNNVEVNSSNNFNSNLAKPQNATNSTQINTPTNNMLPMNQIASMDRSIYIKTLLGLPQTFSAILLLAQSKVNLLNNHSLMFNNFNQDLLKNQKMIAELFNLSSENINMQTNALNNQKDMMALFFSGMIHMPEIAELIKKNSKQAIANLILAMASASKNGMTNDQIRETMSLINSCVAMAESNNPAQTLKSLMMLYLPWLPLSDGVGFDLEINSAEGENESVDSRLSVLIQTKNFGNVKGIFTLTTSNSIDILITCTEDFPKKTLLKSLQDESSTLATNTNIDIEAIQTKEKRVVENHEAKVNLSATNEMNPYLLLMAHAFIRNTIFIDSNSLVEADDHD